MSQTWKFDIATPKSLIDFEKLVEQLNQYMILAERYTDLEERSKHWKDKHMYLKLSSKYIGLCEAIQSALDSYIDMISTDVSLPNDNFKSTVITVT